MINETIFLILLFLFVVFLIITLWKWQVAFGAFTIILGLLLAWQLFPTIGGIEYQTGAIINESGGGYIVSNTYSAYTNTYLATTFMLIVLFLTMQLVTYIRDEKRAKEESID